MIFKTFVSACVGSYVSFSLSVDLSEDNVKGANDRHNVSKHVVLANMVSQGQVEEAGGLDLAPVGPAGAVTDQVHAELPLGSLDGGVGGASRERESLGEQLEVVDERLHRCLHLSSARGHTLSIVSPHVTSRHLVEALLNDPETLPHLRHPHEVPVITVSIAAHGHVKVNQVIGPM